MSTLRFSVSLPDDTHPDIEVSVEQVGEPNVEFSVSVAEGVGIKTAAASSIPRASGKRARTAIDEYALGGYAGI